MSVATPPLPPPLPSAPTKVKIGPNDHGRRMTLAEYQSAETPEGMFCELSRGRVVIVGELANYLHHLIVLFLRDSLVIWKHLNPGVIAGVAGGAESKVVVPTTTSDRHPDVSIYLAPPAQPVPQPWRAGWVAEIVVEVVSESSVDRDYDEKPDDYWSVGVREYWIVDPRTRQVQVMRRGQADWDVTILRRGQKLTTPLLPGYEVDVEALMRSGDPARVP